MPVAAGPAQIHDHHSTFRDPRHRREYDHLFISRLEIDAIDSAYYTVTDGDGKRRRRAKQATMWVATQDVPRSAAHPFYTRRNQILDKSHFDGWSVCQPVLRR
jgi:hypothetical protein